MDRAISAPWRASLENDTNSGYLRLQWTPDASCVCSHQEDRVLSHQIAASAGNARDSGVQGPVDGHAPTSNAVHAIVLSSLDDDGAQDIVSIDLGGKSSEADTMVIASGRSTRHVAAVAEKLLERLKEELGVTPRTEGRTAADWVLIDAGDVIVHIFRPEVRDFYQLEKMWMPAADATARAQTSS